MTLVELFQVFTPDFVVGLAESIAIMLGVVGIGYGILWFFTERSL